MKHPAAMPAEGRRNRQKRVAPQGRADCVADHHRADSFHHPPLLSVLCVTLFLLLHPPSSHACFVNGNVCSTGFSSPLELKQTEQGTFTVQCASYCDALVGVTVGNQELVTVTNPFSITAPLTMNIAEELDTFTVDAHSATGSTTIPITWKCDIGEGACEIAVTVKEPEPEPQPGSTANTPDAGTARDPVNTDTGELLVNEPYDLYIPGPFPLYFKRHYASYLRRNYVVGDLGKNWLHNFDHHLFWNGTTAIYRSASGRVTKFLKIDNTWTQQNNSFIPYQVVIAGGANPVVYDPVADEIYTFDYSTGGPVTGRLIQIEDRSQHTIQISYNSSGQLTQAVDGGGRTLTFNYNAAGLLSSVSDGTRNCQYQYTDTVDPENLTVFTDAAGGQTLYTYADTSTVADHALMLTRTRAAGNTPYSQTYYGTSDQYVSGRVKTQTDALGNAFTFTYDTANGLTTVTDPLTFAISQAHDNGALASFTDTAGGTIALGSDSAGRRNAITDQLGQQTAYAYDANSGRLSGLTSPGNQTTTITHSSRTHSSGITLYDVSGITYPDGTSESFLYDAKGNMTKHTDQGGNVWSWAYTYLASPPYQMATKVETNPAGGQQTITYGADGMATAITDPAGNQTSYGYDLLKRLTTITYADSSQESFTYNVFNQVQSHTNQRGYSLVHGYNANTLLTSITDPNSNAITYGYDTMDRPTAITFPAGNPASMTYDALGRIKSQTGPNNNTVTYTYDAQGRVTAKSDGVGGMWTKTYNANGWMTSLTDALGKTTTYAYDSQGHITEIQTPAGTVIQYGYDAMGRVATVSTDGFVTAYTYDSQGLVVGHTLPGQGVTAGYTRDAMGNITTVTDPAGNDWTMSYDAGGRLTSESDPLGQQISYSYNARNWVSQVTFPDAATLDYTYDGRGNITSLAYADGKTLNYTYDAMDRMTAASGLSLAYDAKGSITESNTITNSYNAARDLTAVTLASGKALSYTYDQRGQVTAIADWLSGQITFTYDANGRMLTLTRPNGVVTTHTYNDDGRLIGIQETKGAASLAQIALTKNGRGAVTSATRTDPVTLNLSLGDTQQSYSYNAASQLADATYDTMGRLTNDGTRSYTWSQGSTLTSYGDGTDTVTFTYDGNGNRLSRDDGTVTTQYTWNYAFDRPCPMIMLTGAETSYHVFTPKGILIYSILADGSRRYYHYDEVGNTSFVTNEAGTVEAAYLYSPYGAVLVDSANGTVDNPFTFQGRYGVMQEGDFGLYFMNARYYDSGLGRFISRDPVKSLDPRAINPYQYALGNPMQFIDPLGQDGVGADDYASNAFNTGTTALNQVAGNVADKMGRVAKAAGSGPAAQTLQQNASRLTRTNNALQHAGEAAFAVNAALEINNTVNAADRVKKKRDDEINRQFMTFDTAFAEAQRLYKEKRINIEQYEILILRINAGLEESLRGVTEASFWELALEYTKGLLKSLGTATPITGDQWDAYFGFLGDY